MEWDLRGAGEVHVPGAALTADVCEGSQAVAEQLHVPSGGIHAALAGVGQLPCQPARSARSDPRAPRADPDPASSLGQPLSLEEQPQGPPWRDGSLSSLQTWALSWDPFPGRRPPPTWESEGPVTLWVHQERPGFAVPGAGWRRDAGASPNSLGRLRGRGAAAAVLSHPACPAGTWWPGLTHRQRPLPRCPATRVWRPYTPGARPLPPRPSRPPRPPGSAPRPRQRGPDTGRRTSRRKVSPRKEEGRGGARGGGEEKGRERKGRARAAGRREARSAGPLHPHRKPLGRPVAGTRPQATNYNNSNEDELLPRCQAAD